MTTGPATGVRAVVWDADGVLQHGPADWRERIDALHGPGFTHAVLAAEAPALRGEVPLRDALRQVLQVWPGAAGLRAALHDPASGAHALRAEVHALFTGAARA